MKVDEVAAADSTKRIPVPGRLLVVMTAEAHPAKEAEASSFEAFCRRAHPRLVGAMSLYCGDAGVAEDLAQEALARAYRDWSSVSQLASSEAWVHRVAMNLAHSWYRHLRLARRPVHPTGAEQLALDDGLVLRRAVSMLPRRQRQAIVIRYFLDWTVADAAEVMGCAEGTVRALTSQGLAVLRAELGEDWKEDR